MAARKGGLCHGNGAGFLQPPVFPVAPQAAAIWLGWDAGTRCCGTALRSHCAVLVRSQKDHVCLSLDQRSACFSWEHGGFCVGERKRGHSLHSSPSAAGEGRGKTRMKRSPVTNYPSTFSLLCKKLNLMSAVFSTPTVHCTPVSGRATVGVQTAEGAHRAFPGHEDRRACDFRGGEGWRKGRGAGVLAVGRGRGAKRGDQWLVAACRWVVGRGHLQL